MSCQHCNLASIETTYTIAFTPRQYLSHMERKRGWPPRSQLRYQYQQLRGHYVALSCGFTCSRARYVPFESHMAFLHPLHVEANCRYGAGAQDQSKAASSTFGHLLDGELSTLTGCQPTLSPMAVIAETILLTASTLSNDVLPA